jgi:hypothetical protein
MVWRGFSLFSKFPNKAIAGKGIIIAEDFDAALRLIRSSAFQWRKIKFI